MSSVHKAIFTNEQNKTRSCFLQIQMYFDLQAACECSEVHRLHCIFVWIVILQWHGSTHKCVFFFEQNDQQPSISLFQPHGSIIYVKSVIEEESTPKLKNNMLQPCQSTVLNMASGSDSIKWNIYFNITCPLVMRSFLLLMLIGLIMQLSRQARELSEWAMFCASACWWCQANVLPYSCISSD